MAEQLLAARCAILDYFEHHAQPVHVRDLFASVREKGIREAALRSAFWVLISNGEVSLKPDYTVEAKSMRAAEACMA